MSLLEMMLNSQNAGRQPGKAKNGRRKNNLLGDALEQMMASSSRVKTAIDSRQPYQQQKYWSYPLHSI